MTKIQVVDLQLIHNVTMQRYETWILIISNTIRSTTFNTKVKCLN